MKHLHKLTGLTFECGELIEFDTGKTFDMTVITLWDYPECDQPPIIIGYYFGEYDEETTNNYIDEWLQQHDMRVGEQS